MAPMTGFPSIVEPYLGDLRRIRDSGGATTGESAQRRGCLAEAKGVLRWAAEGPGSRACPLRAVRGETGAARGAAERGPTARAWRGGGEVGAGRCLTDGRKRAGEPVLGPLPAGAGDQLPRLGVGGERLGRKLVRLEASRLADTRREDQRSAIVLDDPLGLDKQLLHIRHAIQ